MREITTKVYQYKELSEEAKEKARQWYLEGFDFQFEWDCMQDDAKMIGLKLKEWEYCRYATGDFINSAGECAGLILKEHGEQCRTYKTASDFLDSLKTVSDEERIAEIEQDFLKSILEDYRIMTDEQYEYVQSEDAIADMMASNEYEFTIEGRRF